MNGLSAARAATDRTPSAAQIEAGNYAHGKLSVHGLNISLENPKGSVRRGIGRNGQVWETKVTADYGYILGSEGNDGEHVDCFIGPDHDSELVYVVDQAHPGGRFDEHKVILCTDSEVEARALYLSNYAPGWKGLGAITALTLDEFKAWLTHHDTSKPMADKKRAPRHVFKAMLESIILKAEQLGFGFSQRKDPEQPGVRGGRYYRTETGHVRYGEQPSTPERIAASLSEAGRRTQERLNQIGAALEKLPDGTTVKGWKKFSIPGESGSFWSRRKRTVVGGHLAEEVGMEALIPLVGREALGLKSEAQLLKERVEDEHPAPGAWEQVPSVHPGGKPYFFIRTVDGKKQTVMWDRYNEQWGVSVDDIMQVRRFPTSEAAKEWFNQPRVAPFKRYDVVEMKPEEGLELRGEVWGVEEREDGWSIQLRGGKWWSAKDFTLVTPAPADVVGEPYAPESERMVTEERARAGLERLGDDTERPTANPLSRHPGEGGTEAQVVLGTGGRFNVILVDTDAELVLPVSRSFPTREKAEEYANTITKAKEPEKPGERGGRYYRTKTGHVRYGEKPGAAPYMGMPRARVTFDELRQLREWARLTWPNASAMHHVEQVAILLHPHVYKVWQKLNPGWAIEAVSNEAGPGFEVYQQVLPFEKYGVEGRVYWNRARTDYYGHSPENAWNGVWRNTKHMFIEDLRGLMDTGNDLYDNSEPMVQARWNGLRMVRSTAMPEGFAVGDKVERADGGVETVVGAQDGALVVRREGETGRSKPRYLYPEAVTSGRVPRVGMVKSQVYATTRRPAAHDHDNDTGDTPVVVLDLNGTLTPSDGIGPEGLQPPWPGVKEALDYLKAGGCCLHIATALLSPMHASADVCETRKKQIEGWVAQHGLPIDFVCGKVLAHLYYDDRMVRVHPAGWNITLDDIVKRLDKRFNRDKNGTWRRTAIPEVGERFQLPDPAGFAEDHPRGLVGPVIDIDMHRCLTDSSSSKLWGQPRAGAVNALRALYDAGITIHLSCQGWDPTTHDKEESRERLAGLRLWCADWGIPYDEFVCKDHGDVFVDDHGVSHKDWTEDLPRLMSELEKSRELAKAQQLGFFGEHKEIKEPGKRGGHYYRTETGRVRYGDAPVGLTAKRISTYGSRQWAVVDERGEVVDGPPQMFHHSELGDTEIMGARFYGTKREAEAALRSIHAWRDAGQPSPQLPTPPSDPNDPLMSETEFINQHCPEALSRIDNPKAEGWERELARKRVEEAQRSYREYREKMPSLIARKCPGCQAVNPTVRHLQDEYLDLTKHGLNKMFGHNAERARGRVGRMLLDLGVTTIPNIFGPIDIQKAMQQLGLFGPRPEPQQPGIRGGQYYRTGTGHVKYGEKPAPPVVPPAPVTTPDVPDRPVAVKAESVEPDIKAAEKLRGLADAMVESIERYQNPSVSHQNVTARRAHIAANMAQHGDWLADVQAILYGLADLHENGKVPPALANVRSRALVEDLLRRPPDAGHPHSPDYEANRAAGKLRSRFPFPKIDRHALKDLKEKIVGKQLPADVRRVFGGLSLREPSEYSNVRLYGKEEIEAVRHVAKKLVGFTDEYGHKSDTYARSTLDDLRESGRAIDAGLDNEEKWDTAAIAIQAFKKVTDHGPARRIAEMERALIGRKIPGYFPTPAVLAERLVEMANVDALGLSILEPSAGKGNIADAIHAAYPNNPLQTFETITDLTKILEAKGHKVAQKDFLAVPAEPTYDRIIQNPPFEHGQDVDHVYHAYKLLKPGGRLVSIMGEHPFFAEDKKSIEFRSWLSSFGGTEEKLPERSFMSSERPTGVNVRVIAVNKPK